MGNPENKSIIWGYSYHFSHISIYFCGWTGETKPRNTTDISSLDLGAITISFPEYVFTVFSFNWTLSPEWHEASFPSQVLSAPFRSAASYSQMTKSWSIQLIDHSWHENWRGNDARTLIDDNRWWKQRSRPWKWWKYLHRPSWYHELPNAKSTFFHPWLGSAWNSGQVQLSKTRIAPTGPSAAKNRWWGRQHLKRWGGCLWWIYGPFEVFKWDGGWMFLVWPFWRRYVQSNKSKTHIQ